MDNKRVEEKLDKVADDISQINITLAKQEVSLAEHIRRTNVLEQKLEPVEKHVAMVNGGLKIVGIVALLVGIIEGIVKIIGG